MSRSVETSNWPLPANGVRFTTPPRLRRMLARNPLTAGCYPLALGFYPEAGGHRMLRLAPDDHLLIYCRAGQGWLETGDGRFDVVGGDLLLLPRGRMHAYGADPQRPWSIYWVHFEGELVEDFLRPLGPAGLRRIGAQPRLLADFDALLGLRRHGLAPLHFVHAAHQLQTLLTSLAVLPARGVLKSGRVLDIDAVQAVMRAHLHDSLNLDQLAAQFKLSRFHFAKTYRALTGHAPIQDFIQLKMAHACRLLDEGDQGIRQIAEQLGYEDVYYFSRLFRKVVGMAPSHYRALHQG
ncbi:MmsAB operon transcriptional regulator MmsR [Pseudomonas sp. No.21]|jgi:AraC-like DNA-binding protein|uniref:MmsAB operon regulatory protein n=1 Tax=Pseudomonas tohonis TaxID=2725477 RepID=A0A6J4E8R1_9PSED|nr:MULTISPECIES: AraC family transcriptional regulator [Pseudomonas]MDW3710512.1 AraC family transcriptional regulator [Pseudomonas sp. 2023EL-01195]PZE14078.1 AraC family transcriptional regulator [Pseudomonas sp. 57B-090624]UXY51503.1 AraC family transcriptional regulator [Pseudomonas tohonis]BBP84742.1 MmsAB operon regulatory protein [Pseudomonas sp. Pc102]BCG26222.1 MmsAB operon regulatory protein [Pseudomonas tohonis]